MGERRGRWERPSGGQVDTLGALDEAQGSQGVREGFLEKVAHRLRLEGWVRTAVLEMGCKRGAGLGEMLRTLGT